MKRLDLIRQIEQNGCVFIQHGGCHDWYQKPRTGACQTVARHREIKDHLAKHILRKLAD